MQSDAKRLSRAMILGGAGMTTPVLGTDGRVYDLCISPECPMEASAHVHELPQEEGERT